jgi:hypothetical protein
MSIEIGTSAVMVKKAAKTGLLALVAACVSMPMLAQNKPVVAAAAKPVAKPAIAADEESEGAESAQKPSDGIKVHGHWVIELKDKDGKVVDHRDFQNALNVNNGTSLLTYLLNGQWIPSNYGLSAHQTGTTSSAFGISFSSGYITYQIIPAGTNAATASCTTNADPNSGNTSYCSTGLVVATSGAGNSANGPVGASTTLTGQFTAIAPIAVDSVDSDITMCLGDSNGAVNMTVTQCRANTYPGGNNAGRFIFTEKKLSSVINVAVGQTLAITLVITFS